MKNKFDWEKFLNTDNRIAVNCKTEEEVELFCNLIHEHGLRWRDYKLYAEKTNWSHHKNGICYERSGGFSDKEWFKENGYEVIEFGDYDFIGESEKMILNAEFYKEKIDALQGFFMVMRDTNEVKPCNASCKECIFSNSKDPCRASIVKWLLSPYKPPKEKPVISDIARKFLEVCNPENYIARDKDGLIFFYKEKPSKTESVWSAEGEYVFINKAISDDLCHGFDFIRWEDDEPWKVADLLQIAAEQ